VKELLAKDLTADTAEQVALLNNQNLQATYEDLGVAQAELVEAGLLHNPTLSAEVRFPRHARLRFEVDVTQSFLDLFFMPLRKRAAGAGFEAAKARVTHAVLETAADVRAAFYRAQGAAQLVEMRQNILIATDASAEAARRLRAAGNITELALANEEAMDGQAKVDLARAKRGALDAREELSALMGVWGKDIEWKMSARLPDLPGEDVAKSELASLALSQREDLAAAKQEVEVAGASLGLNRSTAPITELTLRPHQEQVYHRRTTPSPTVSIPLSHFNKV
jgi:cobalt-zinc-cadmium efflux system outer membrane protein